METITIHGSDVRIDTPEGKTLHLEVREFFGHLVPAWPDSAGTILPDGVKAIFRLPRGLAVVHQTNPRIHRLRWIAPDSESPYGPGTRYRDVRIGLPFLVVLAVFDRLRGDRLVLGHRNECFFSNRSLEAQGVDTELCYPALLNCSRFPDHPRHPLSWICTQHLDESEYSNRSTLDDSLRAGLKALLHHTLEAAFNLSSEHHELNSWYSESVKAGIDPRIATVEAWEEATAEDPRFVLGVPWLPTGCSLRKIVGRIAATQRGRSSGPTSSSDLVRILLDRGSRSRRKTG